MPTYEYACRDCGEHLEVVQSFRDEALQVCPSCGGRLRKVFSAAGIIFKGSGYYVTDSRQPASASASGSEGSESQKDGDSEKKSKKAAPSSSGSDATSSSGSESSESGSAAVDSA